MTDYDYTTTSFCGFSAETIKSIKLDGLRFIDYELLSDHAVIDGIRFGSEDIYYISKTNRNSDINIQVAPRGKSMCSYKYGIYIARHFDVLEIIPYHCTKDAA